MFPFQSNTTYAVKIVTSGASISTFVNDVLIDTTTDAKFATGRIGFRQYMTEHAHIDNIRVSVNNPVLLSDSFSNNLNQWTAIENSSIESGELSIDFGGYMESAAGSEWSNYSFEADVSIKANAAGLNFRVKDSNNYYMWQLNSSDQVLRAHAKVDGQFTVINFVK